MKAPGPMAAAGPLRRGTFAATRWLLVGVGSLLIGAMLTVGVCVAAVELGTDAGGPAAGMITERHRPAARRVMNGPQKAERGRPVPSGVVR